MALSIGLVLAAFRVGLTIRRARTRKRPPPRGARARHLRLARPALLLLLLGAMGGPLSSLVLRGWSPFGTLHGLLGGACALLFFATWRLGRRLEAGELGAREAHARFGALGVLGAAVAAIAGFVLLP
jgi:hypothetical protein